MERVVGPFRGASSAPVLQSEAPGPPLDCGVPAGDAGAEPQAPREDCPPASPPPPCPGGAFLPVTPQPEERRALGVGPPSASSAPAVPGLPRDSAGWMLCVAGAKLKVSGAGASAEGGGGEGGGPAVSLGEGSCAPLGDRRA